MKIELPKWPALTVFGKKITKNQAAEIIIRTQDFYFHSNNREFLKELNSIVGIKQDKKYSWDVDFDDVNKARRKYRCLNLDYLQNERIVSSWIGGPHGWCNWDGNIFCNNYNIGKWPNIEYVLKEWEVIAKAFPYLELTSQLWNKETSEEKSFPVVEFQIKNGTVEILESPKEYSIYPVFDLRYDVMEIGCTIKQFKDALKITEK